MAAPQSKEMANETLSGPEKAAIFLLSVNQERASAVLRLLSEREIEKVTNYAARLGQVLPETVALVKQEFCELVESDNPLAFGQPKNQMRDLLTRVLPAERVEEMREFLEGHAEESEGLESLKWLDPQVIAAFLRNEHPQTIALILAYIEPVQAAQVLNLIPQRLQPDVVQRLSHLERISPSIVNDINEVIKTELLATGAGRSSYVGGIESAAEIMNHLEKSAESAIFERLDEVNPSLADGIRELMFVFDDLAKVDDRAMQAIMREVANDQLILALKTAGAEIQQKIFKNISTRAAEMIREELSIMGPVRLSDVEGAQQEIVKIARRLESEGKIALGGSGGEAFV